MKTTMTLLALLGIMASTPSMVSTAKADTVSERDELNGVASFCHDRLRVLKSAYRQAEIQSQNGNVDDSVAILERGLRDANARTNPRLGNTITAKSIRRGLTLLDNLKATSNGRQKVRSINNFLFNYYLFIEKVSNQLDIPYYSYRTGFSRIANTDVQFERAYVQFSKEQVEMVLDTLTSSSNEGRGEIVYPVGSAEVLLTALRVTTLALANDLSDSIFASRYACTIEDLDYVSSDIAAYLAGRSTYQDDFTAVQELVGATKQAMHGMRSCHREDEYERSAPQTTDALSRPFRLESGTTQQLPLAGHRYVKKLIISAEGVRNDAMFEVVVNGEVKGTVYVPGRDPSYFVTIEDDADSIEFVSRGGAAIISRVLVVTE